MEAKRITDIGGRPATQLTNGVVRVVVDDKGGMVPELSMRREQGYLNTHWIPYFRSTSGAPYNPGTDADFWTGELLYDIAGSFPCLPSFGAPSRAHGESYDAHGTTAHGRWQNESYGVLEGEAAYAVSSLAGSPKELFYRKYDLLLDGQPVHYSLLEVSNLGGSSLRINAAWHNTVAPPFLESGSLVDMSAERFATVPSPNEFDDTGRLEAGREFDDLRSAPLRGGGTLDLRRVPGMVGYTDFVTGAVPESAPLGWSSVVNPHLRALYLSFFCGPAAAREEEIVLSFNDLWMQYGGRRFTPWAFTNGGSDQTFCLGVENSVGAYANGIGYALDHPMLLGRPTTVEIPPASSRRLLYGVLAAPYRGGSLDAGVDSVEADGEGLVVTGQDGAGRESFSADTEFERIRELVERLA